MVDLINASNTDTKGATGMSATQLLGSASGSFQAIISGYRRTLLTLELPPLSHPSFHSCLLLSLTATIQQAAGTTAQTAQDLANQAFDAVMGGKAEESK